MNHLSSAEREKSLTGDAILARVDKGRKAYILARRAVSHYDVGRFTGAHKVDEAFKELLGPDTQPPLSPELHQLVREYQTQHETGAMRHGEAALMLLSACIDFGSGGSEHTPVLVEARRGIADGSAV